MGGCGVREWWEGDRRELGRFSGAVDEGAWLGPVGSPHGDSLNSSLSRVIVGSIGVVRQRHQTA